MIVLLTFHFGWLCLLWLDCASDFVAVRQMYDTDGGGELEIDEFTSVLNVAGFSVDEAQRIFSSVDKDGGGR